MAIYNMPMSVGNAAKTSKALADVDVAQAQAGLTRANTRAKREEVDDFILGAEQRASKRKAQTAQNKKDFENVGIESEAKVAEFKANIAQSVQDMGESRADTAYTRAGAFLAAEPNTPESKQELAAFAMSMGDDADMFYGEGGEVDESRVRLYMKGLEEDKKQRQSYARAEQGGDIQRKGMTHQGSIQQGLQDDQQAFAEGQETRKVITDRNTLEREFQMKVQLQALETEAAYNKARIAASASRKQMKQEDVGLKDAEKYASSMFNQLDEKLNEVYGFDMSDDQLKALSYSLATQTKAMWQETNQAMFHIGKDHLVPSPESITLDLLDAAVREGHINDDGSYLDPATRTHQGELTTAVEQKAQAEAEADRARLTTVGTVANNVPAVAGETYTPNMRKTHAARTFEIPTVSPRGQGPGTKAANKRAKAINSLMQTKMANELGTSDNIQVTTERWQAFNKVANTPEFLREVKDIPDNQVLQLLETLTKGK